MDIRVWVGCMAHYNNGELVGDWVDAVDAGDWVCPKADPTNVYINCEETWCYDHEIPGVKGELSPMEAVEIGQAVAEMDDDRGYAFLAWCQEQGEPRTTDSVRTFNDAFREHWDSERDYAQDWAEEVEGYRLSEVAWPLNHIDWDAATEEMFSGSHYSIDDPRGGVWVFWQH